MSHPMWVRGLKHYNRSSSSGQYQVAPHVGAWIETLKSISYALYNSSHPMWVRGLKL